MKWKGLTLVELLVVITILSILAGAIVATINPTQQLKTGRDFKRKSDISAIQTALEQYRHDQSAYPTPVVGTYHLNTNVCSIASPLTAAGITYMTKIPCDPAAGTAYNTGYYYYNSDGTTYTLAACLENASDSDGTATAPLPAPAGSCSTYYVVTNQ